MMFVPWGIESRWYFRLKPSCSLVLPLKSSHVATSVAFVLLGLAETRVSRRPVPTEAKRPAGRPAEAKPVLAFQLSGELHGQVLAEKKKRTDGRVRGGASRNGLTGMWMPPVVQGEGAGTSECTAIRGNWSAFGG